jgi:hypothetical protein
MTETTGKTSPKLSKKEARKIVYQKLSNALAEYKASVKEKKFDSNLKKASKLFAADIAKAIAKQKQQLKKPAKIKAVKDNLPSQGAVEAVV